MGTNKKKKETTPKAITKRFVLYLQRHSGAEHGCLSIDATGRIFDELALGGHGTKTVREERVSEVRGGER